MDSAACNISRTSVPSLIFVYFIPMRILQEKKVNVKHGYKMMKLEDKVLLRSQLYVLL